MSVSDLEKLKATLTTSKSDKQQIPQSAISKYIKTVSADEYDKMYNADVNFHNIGRLRNTPNKYEYNNLLGTAEGLKQRKAALDNALGMTTDTSALELRQKYGDSELDEMAATQKELEDRIRQAEREAQSYEYNLEGYNMARDAVTAKDFAKYADGDKIDFTVDDVFNDSKSQMSTDEVKIYNYFRNKYGDDKAQEYLYYLQEQLNARSGKAKADETLDSAISPYLSALKSGVQSFGEGLTGWFYGEDGEYKPISADEYKNYYLQQGMADRSGAAKMGYDLLYSTSNMLPSIALSSGLTALTGNPVLGAAVGSASMGLSAGGNSYEAALKEGYSPAQAVTYGIVNGALEGGLQYALGGVGALGGKTMGKIGLKIGADGIRNTALRLTAKIAPHMGSEFAEEYLQEVIDRYVRNAILNEDNDTSFFTEEALYNGVLGALTAGLLESGSIVGADIKTQRVGRNILNNVGGSNALEQTAVANGIADLSAYTDSKGNIKPYQAVALYGELGLKISENNKAQIEAKLVENGIAQADAAVISDALTSVADGGVGVSDAAAALINENDAIKAAVNEYVATDDFKSIIRNNERYSDLIRKPTKEKKVKAKDTTPKVDAVDEAQPETEEAEAKAEEPTTEIRIRQLAAEHGLNANEVRAVYDSGDASIDGFTAAFNAVYLAGKNGSGIANIVADGGAVSKLLTSEQIMSAYRMGVIANDKAAKAKAAEKATAAENNKSKEEKDNEQSDGVRVRRGGERSDGENTEGQVRELETGSRADKAGQAKTRPTDSEADTLTNGKEIKRINGVEQKGGIFRVNGETDAMRRAKALAEKHGYRTEFFMGGNAKIENGGEVRGIVNLKNKLVAVRVDHPRYDAYQIMAHEMAHDAIAKGDINLDEIRTMLEEQFTATELDDMASQYAAAFTTADGKCVMTAEEAFEEICCDALGGINVFAEMDVDLRIDYPVLDTIRSYVNDNESTQSRAPPSENGEVKYSRSQRGRSIEIETMENNRFERLRTMHEHLPEEWFAFTAGKFYIYSNQSFTDYTILVTANITEHNKAYIEHFVEEISNGTFPSSETFNRWTSSFRRGKGRNSWYSNGTEHARNVRRNDGVDGTAHRSRNTSGFENRGLSQKNSRDSKSVKEKFSMEVPIEKKKNLIALHNLTEDKLLKTLKLGGFPMPSIAITKSDIPHTNFGDITVVFGRETIDPQFDRRNTVYSADAWTPLFPPVEYEANTDVEARIRNKYYELAKKHGYEFAKPLYSSANYVEEVLNNYGGEQGTIEHFFDDTGMMQVFLADTGKSPVEKVMTEYVSRLSDEQITEYDFLINALGKDVLGEMTAKANQSPLAARREWLENHGELLKEAYRQYLVKDGMTEELANEAIANMKPAMLLKDAIAARNYMKNGAETRREEVDTAATKEAIKAAVNMSEYKAWLKELYSGVEKSNGVYNQKELYTASGNRRSFKQTHFPATLDGIVKAMAAQGDGNSRNVMGFHGVKSLRAGTAERFKSIADMHKLERRLKHLTEEEAAAISDALDERLSTLLHEIYNAEPHSSYSNELMELNALGEVMVEAAELKSVNVDSVKKLFAKYNHHLSDKLAQETVELLFDINQMPVNIFEAKPERAVGFGEIKAVIIPNTVSGELKSKLRTAGIDNVMEYESGNDAQRMELANSIDDIHFSQEPMTLKQLEAENKKLKKQLEYWRNQTRKNPKKTVREGDVKKLAKAIVESVPTDIKPYEIVPDLMELGNYILNEKELRYTEVHDMAERIATDLIENATEVVDDNKEMREELKSYLRTVKFRDDGSPEYKELRSKYRGRVHFAKKGKFVTNKGIGVDTAYMELQESLGYGLFPEEIINTAEQLECIMMAVDRLAPIYRNPNTTYAKELIAEVTNSIIDGMLDETVRQSPLTAAERYQQRMFAQKKHFLELLAKQKEHNEKVFKEYKQRQAEKLAKKKMSEKNAAIRDKIQGVTKKIRKLYNSKDKHRNVKEVQKGFAGAALSLSNVLFSPATNADIVRAGTAYDYATPEEAVLLNKYEGLLAKRDPLVEQYTSLSRQIAADNRNAKNGNPTLSEEERNAIVQQHDELKAKIADITPQIKALDKQLADLLKREKIRIDSLAVSKAVEELSNAYAATKDSEQSYASYEEAIKLRIDQLKTDLGNTALKELNTEQLNRILECYNMVYEAIKNANTVFSHGKRVAIEELAQAANSEIREISSKPKDTIVAVETVKKIYWKSLIPVYYFERLGSKTLMGLYDDLMAAQDDFSRIVGEADDFITAQKKKYGFSTWKLDEVEEFRSKNDKKLELTLEERMSLYAYSFREQAAGHLENGGIVRSEAVKLKEDKDGETKKTLFKRSKNVEGTFQISKETQEAIFATLTEEQKNYVKEMQRYLSDTMGAYGNKASMQLYGIELFKEKYYFPLKTSSDYRAVENVVAGNVSLKNKGMTKPTVPKAINPIVLENFDKVATRHIVDMATYSCFAVPIDSLNKVYHYSAFGEGEAQSLRATIEATFGTKQATEYMNKFISDINGGVSADEDVPTLKAFRTLKAVKTMTISTVVQQPTAVIRAMSEINPKYFVHATDDTSFKHQKRYDLITKYAPIARLKAIGGYDVGGGKSMQNYLNRTRYGEEGAILKRGADKVKGFATNSDYRMDVMMAANSHADMFGWNVIWGAVWAETRATTNLEVNSEAFFEHCGKRFTEVVNRTQVYDSTLSRSDYMRQHGFIAKLATAYMGEPIMTVNMIQNAVAQASRGKISVGHCLNTIASVLISQLFADLARSAIYALRRTEEDGEEDKSYGERYASALGDAMSDSLGVIHIGDMWIPTVIGNSLPYVRDALRIVNGYTLERSDFELTSMAADILKAVVDENKTSEDVLREFMYTVAAAYGLPMEQYERDITGIINAFTQATSGESMGTTGRSMLDEWYAAFKGKDRSTMDRLEAAILDGNTDKTAFLLGTYGDEDKAKNAYTNACRALYTEGKISKDDALDYLLDYGYREDDASKKVNAWACTVETDIAYNELYDNYADGTIDRDTAIAYLQKYGEKDENSAATLVQKWDCQIESGIAYNDLTDAFIYGEIGAGEYLSLREKYGQQEHSEVIDDFTGKVKNWYTGADNSYSLSEKEAVELLTSYCDYSEKNAKSYLADAKTVYEYRVKYPDLDGAKVNISAIGKYETYIKGKGIEFDDFITYKTEIGNCKGTDKDGDGKTDSGSKRAAQCRYINSLRLTTNQKDALYLACGLNANTLYNTPWH